MKCPKCNTQLQTDGTGKIFCPTCNSNLKKSISLLSITFNDITFYKTLKSKNVMTSTYLTPKDVEKLIGNNIEVKIEGNI